ncbi:MAG: DEAD/DEAH box helicase [Armatimonadetes bacterium]|nr:DEAD/DEAH box helicase [Armatimonadota bacterium]
MPNHESASDQAFERANRIAAGLFPHQVDGVAFLIGRRRAILADDMGLGKTRQAIVALREAAPTGPYLVVCPASVKRNWEREILAIDAKADVRVVSGSADAATGPWTVINYDILQAHIEALTRVPWSGIIFDEAHYLRNHTSRRSQMGRRLVSGDRAGGPMVLALTGTPLTNRPRDLFPLLQLMDHPMGKSFLSFARRYCAAYQNDYGWVTDGASNLEELSVQLHGVMLRRTKSEVLFLPPKIRTWLPVDVPDGTATQEMVSVVSHLMQSQAGGQRTSARGAGGDRVKLLSLLTKARHKLAAAKVKSTLDLVDGAVEQGEKVIVFSCFDEPIRKIAEHYKEGAVLLTGATPSGKRQELVDRFQNDPAVRVFAANLIAGGIGLNLTAARQVVFNDLDWVPANHWQAEDRAYRIGQTGAVNVSYLVADGTVDQFVRNLLEVKAKLVDAVVEGQAGQIDAGSDILTELERLIGLMSPRMADLSSKEIDAEVASRLLREASERYRQEHPESPATAAAGGPREGAIADALAALARALGGPRQSRYRVVSRSKPGSFYQLTVDAGGDVDCTCPGFEYRGMCAHSRDLKTAVARGGAVPAAYQPVA